MKHKCTITKDDLNVWLTALRSGSYKQTVGRLFSGRGYCCLGVYFAAHGEKVPKYEVEDGVDNAPFYERINKLAGEKFTEDLIDLNDRRVKFAKIADVIEEHFKDVLQK
jgi:hypothetical protein